jgi:hypothetical protein
MLAEILDMIFINCGNCIFIHYHTYFKVICWNSFYRRIFNDEHIPKLFNDDDYDSSEEII